MNLVYYSIYLWRGELSDDKTGEVTVFDVEQLHNNSML